MHTCFKSLAAALFLSCACIPAMAQQRITKTAYTQGSREQMEVQYLIDHSIGYAEGMLAKQGAYTPYAAALTVNDSVVMVDGYPDTKDKTLRLQLDDLKAVLRSGANKGMYKAVAIYFDVTVTDPETKQSTDATAAYTEQMNSNASYIFYFPYKKTQLKNIAHGRSFGEIGETEVFIKVSKN